jgi:hypothetical protein
VKKYVSTFCISTLVYDVRTLLKEKYTIWGHVKKLNPIKLEMLLNKNSALSLNFHIMLGKFENHLLSSILFIQTIEKLVTYDI